MNKEKIELLNNSIRDIKDFPKEGIVFKDITTLLNNSEAFNLAMDLMIEEAKKLDIDYIVGLESRGFIFSTPISYVLNKGFVPIRKVGKLPSKTISESYKLEYGEATMEIHTDAFNHKKNAKILVVDDLLATGGTLESAINLIERLDATVVGCLFFMELKFLGAKKRLDKYNIKSLIEID